MKESLSQTNPFKGFFHSSMNPSPVAGLFQPFFLECFYNSYVLSIYLLFLKRCKKLTKPVFFGIKMTYLRIDFTEGRKGYRKPPRSPLLKEQK
jgi:hypothetical protein